MHIGLGPFTTYCPAHIDAVHSWHHPIEKTKAGRFRSFQQIDGGAPVFYGDNVMTTIDGKRSQPRRETDSSSVLGSSVRRLLRQMRELREQMSDDYFERC